MLHRLPESEVSYLASLTHEQQRCRLRDLHSAGWSLSSLAQSIAPPRPKTTLHYWIANADPAHAPSTPPPLPSAPLPSAASTLPLPSQPRIRTISPSVPPDLRPRLAQLGALARRYRAKTPASSPAAQANRELTETALSLRDWGVPTADIALAAGVSYRAMARRLERAQRGL